MAKIVKSIKSRGHWDVSIRPESFLKARLAKATDLYPILERSKVRFRGWDLSPPLISITGFQRPA